eukprot:jgi/Mesen1/7722/ME000407S06945
MVDQLSHLPEAVPGGLISSSQTPQQSSAVMARLLDGQLKVLFISPERLFSETFLAAMARLPHIPLAVVDEAHCVSEWSMPPPPSPPPSPSSSAFPLSTLPGSPPASRHC